MVFINLTPHKVVFDNGKEFKSFEPSGKVARVVMGTTYESEVDGMPIYTEEPVGFEDLPEITSGVILIVSRVVLKELPDLRVDCIAPDTGKTAMRDSSGQIKSVKGFICN